MVLPMVAGAIVRGQVAKKGATSVSNAQVVRRELPKDFAYLQSKALDKNSPEFERRANSYVDAGLRSQIQEAQQKQRKGKKSKLIQVGEEEFLQQQALRKVATRRQRIQQLIQKKEQIKESIKKKKTRKKRLATQRAVLRTLAPLGLIWFLQLPFAVMYLVGLSGSLTFFGISVVSDVLTGVGFLVLLGVCLISIFITYLSLTLAGVNSIGGERGDLKMMTLLGIVIAYLIPGVSLFPIVFAWTWVVWKYPN